MLLPEHKPKLAHGTYDPAKAHDYYLRTRRLHPRQKGAKPVDVQSQRAEVASAVTNLTKKLDELKQVLARKKSALNRDKKAKLKPTASTKAKKSQKSKQYRQTHKSQLKAKAKQAASKSQGGGGSHGGTSTKGVIADPKSGSIKEVESAIKLVETALAAAKARQRALG